MPNDEQFHLRQAARFREMKRRAVDDADMMLAGRVRAAKRKKEDNLNAARRLRLRLDDEMLVKVAEAKADLALSKAAATKKKIDDTAAALKLAREDKLARARRRTTSRPPSGCASGSRTRCLTRWPRRRRTWRCPTPRPSRRRSTIRLPPSNSPERIVLYITCH